MLQLQNGYSVSGASRLVLKTAQSDQKSVEFVTGLSDVSPNDTGTEAYISARSVIVGEIWGLCIYFLYFLE